MITCLFEQGNEALLRHVTADVIVHDGHDRILFVRRAEHLVEGGKIALPGGYVARDERIVDAARREVIEETGYECGELILLHVTSDPSRPGDDRQNVTFLFSALAGERVGDGDDESSEQFWASLEGLPAAEIAFDHLSFLDIWQRYRRGELTIPVLS